MVQRAGRERYDPSFSEFRVVRALASCRVSGDLRSRSILFLVGSRSSPRDPFHPDFLRGVDERAELVKRLRLIDPRERLLLFLWYAAGWPVTSIAAHLGISRVHCYRLRNRAIRRMTADDAAGDEGSVVVPPA